MEAYLNVAAIRPCTVSEGPGKRFAIWLQGCLKRCPGCCNPEMQAIEERHIVAVGDLLELILESVEQNDIEGVSLIGGEPFLQADGLSILASGVHEAGLSVVAFSGYTYEELVSGIPEQRRLLDLVDILIDGPYLEQEPDHERGWIGSSNQKVHYVSDRYDSGMEYSGENSVEILVGENELLVNGWPATG